MDRIQSYEIQEVIGYGGMGVVYKARHLVTGEIRAIKQLHGHFVLNEQIRRRFLEEAKIIGHLDHENIIKVYELLEDSGNLYMIMEYVDGKPLSDVIGKETGPIPSSRAIEIVKQVSKGLGYAHANKLVHRDIKPANILLDSAGKAKIADFGIAKVIDKTQHTAVGTMMGTIAYMSPEQIEGKEIDHRADIYSLGITLYEMLAGRLPFTFSEDDSLVTKLNKLNSATIPDPRAFYPHIPEYLVNIIYKCIAKNKNVRYSSVKEILSDIDKGEELSKYSQRRKFLSWNFGGSTYSIILVKEYAGIGLSKEISRIVKLTVLPILFLIFVVFILPAITKKKIEAPVEDTTKVEAPAVDTTSPDFIYYDPPFTVDTAATVDTSMIN